MRLGLLPPLGLNSGPSYAVTPDVGSVNEGSIVTFNVATSGVPDATTLYWTLLAVSGTINAADFTGGAVNGSFVITANAGQVARTLAADLTTEGAESFKLEVRTGSVAGPVVATSSTVTIGDTSLTPAYTSYRYWRISISATTSDATYAGVSEIELRATLGGADLTTAGTAVTSTSIAFGEVAANALDGSTTTNWNSGAVAYPKWIRIDMGAPTTVAQVAIAPYYGVAAGREPKDFLIEGSDDGTTFTTLKTVTGESGWANGVFKTYDL